MFIYKLQIHSSISMWPLSIVCFSAVCPPACRETHSDGAQSVCRAVASSLEAFQLLRGDLTKISCPLLNYNLPSASVLSLPCSIFLHFGQKNRSPSLFRCQLICAFVCAWHVRVRVNLFQMQAEAVCIWSRSTGSSRAKAVAFLFFFISLLQLPVFQSAPRFLMTSHPSQLLVFFSPSVASLLFTVERHITLFPRPSTQPQVVVFDNVICYCSPFSWSVKLWNPLIETDYQRIFLGFSFLEVSPSYVQLGIFSSLGKKEWNNWWFVIVPGLGPLFQGPRTFLTFRAPSLK